MKTPAVKWGVYALLFTFVWTLIEHFAGWNTTNHQTGQYARMVGAYVFYLFIIIAIFQQRAQQTGSLTFGQGMKTGAIVSLIYSLGVTVWYCLYGEVINKQFKPTLVAFEKAKLDAAHASADAVAAKMKEVDMTTGGSVMSYVFLFVFMFIGGIIISLLASLIASLMKKKAA